MVYSETIRIGYRPTDISKEVRVIIRRKKTICHKARWLNNLDKQVPFQFTPKLSEACVLSEFLRYRAFHTLGPLAEKFLLFPGLRRFA